MHIVGFRHKDLERFWLRGEAHGVVGQYRDKLRAMLTALEEAENIGELETVPGWRLHQLKGDRRGIWSMVVTRNQRLTFRVDRSRVTEIDFEDYH
jgi:proteic killer suppression protein